MRNIEKVAAVEQIEGYEAIQQWEIEGGSLGTSKYEQEEVGHQEKLNQNPETIQIPEQCKGCLKVRARIARRAMKGIAFEDIQANVDQLTLNCEGRKENGQCPKDYQYSLEQVDLV